jgi:hypothetical protein
MATRSTDRPKISEQQSASSNQDLIADRWRLRAEPGKSWPWVGTVS